MAEARPGTGSANAATFGDAAGNFLDGGKTYKVVLPAPIPAKDFWVFTVCDIQTQSLLPTDDKSAGVDGLHAGLRKEADGSVIHLVRPEGAAVLRDQLDSDHAGQRLQCAAPPLRS